jgi:hypothetical protein
MSLSTAQPRSQPTALPDGKVRHCSNHFERGHRWVRLPGSETAFETDRWQSVAVSSVAYFECRAGALGGKNPATAVAAGDTVQCLALHSICHV